MLDKYIEMLAKELEITESLGTEVPGVYAIPIDEEVNVLISTVSDGVELTCTLAPCPTEEEDFFTQALSANLYGEGTDLSVLGIDAEGKLVTLSRSINYSVNYEEFRNIVEDFLNSVEFWIAEIHAY